MRLFCACSYRLTRTHAHTPTHPPPTPTHPHTHTLTHPHTHARTHTIRQVIFRSARQSFEADCNAKCSVRVVVRDFAFRDGQASADSEEV